MNKRKRVSSVDVAKEAGVSRTTVSYVLNNVEGVKLKEETRRKVWEAAKKLGYFPNHTAQALKTNKSMSIGIVSRRRIDEHRFVPIIGGIHPILARKGYNILFCSDEKDEEGIPNYYRLYKSKKIDGIIFISYQEEIKYEDVEHRVKLAYDEQIPCVFVDYHIKDPLVNCVDINYFQGAYAMTEHLIKKGHRSIALLIPDRDTQQEKQRLNGVKKAVEMSEGIELKIYQTANINDYQSIIDNILEERKVTAIIAAWIHLAFDVLYAANSKGIKMPDDIAVAALANNGFENISYPRLTTCDLSLHELGKAAGELLLRALDKPTEYRNLMIGCKVVERETT